MIQSVKAFQEEEMTTNERVKMILGLVGGIAAEAAVSAVLGGLMPSGRGWKHILRITGTFIIAIMIGDKTDEYICKVYDDTVGNIMDAKRELIAEKVKG